MGSITSVLNINGYGKTPIFFGPYLASVPPNPIKKKDDSIRTIAVGKVLAQIVSKIALLKATSRAVFILSLLQVGVGVSNGAEAVVDGLSRIIANLSTDS
jgi:hypothetical protein